MICNTRATHTCTLHEALSLLGVCRAASAAMRHCADSAVHAAEQVVLDVSAEARERVRRGCVPAAFAGHLHEASVRPRRSCAGFFNHVAAGGGDASLRPCCPCAALGWRLARCWAVVLQYGCHELHGMRFWPLAIASAAVSQLLAGIDWGRGRTHAACAGASSMQSRP